MLRLQALQIALTGLVGFNPHYDSNYPQYADELLESRSGLYVNDIMLINPENLTMAMPKVYPAQYPGWEPKAYKRNAMVYIPTSDALYMANRLTTDAEFPLDGGPWREVDALSARLRFVMDASVATVINSLVATNKLSGAKQVVEETRLYHGAGNINARIVKESRFVGFEVVAKQVRDFGIRLRSVGIQVDTPNPNLAIYIYHTSSSVPLKVLKPGFSGVGTFAWAAVADALLMLDSSAQSPGGSFLVGYYEDDVVGQMIERETQWPDYDLPYSQMIAGYSCGTCNPLNRMAVEAWSKNLEFHPFTVAASELNDERTLWNYYSQRYNYKSNFGLNLDVALECDITQFLERNEVLLADALRKTVEVKLLEIFTSSIEDNATAEQARQAAAHNLDNRENYTPGLRKELEKTMAALALDVLDGDSPCAPKVVPGSIYEVRDGVA